MGRNKRITIILLVWVLLIQMVAIGSFGTIAQATSEKVFWNSFKGNHANSGFFNHVTENKLVLQWRHFFRGDYVMPLQVVGDAMYYVDRSGFLCAVDRSTGSEIYRIRIHPERVVTGVDVSANHVVAVMGPAAGRGRSPDMSNLIITFDRKTGKKLWEKTIEVMMMTHPVLTEKRLFLATGKVDETFTRTTGGSMICLNIETGEIEWQRDLDNYAFVMGYPLTYADDVLLAQAYGFDRSTQTIFPPRLYAVNAINGQVLWSKEPLEEGRSFGIPSVRNQEIFLLENPATIAIGGGGGGGRRPGGGGPGARRVQAWLLKVNLKTGETIGRMPIENENFGSFAPTLAQDAIYLSAFTGKIYCIDYDLERIHWQKEYGRFSFFTELTASRNYLYTVLYNGDLLCIAKTNGSIQFRYRIGMYGGIPLLVDDQLIVAGNAIYCFSSNAEPALLVEPSRLFFETFNENEKKQLSFAVLFTGLEPLQGSVQSTSEWLQIRPERIIQNQQTFFVTIDPSKMNPGAFEEYILISTNQGEQRVALEGVFEPLPPLKLEVNIDEEEFYTNERFYHVRGSTLPFIEVWVNDLPLYSQRDGSFFHLIRLREGENTISIHAKDKNKELHFCKERLYWILFLHKWSMWKYIVRTILRPIKLEEKLNPKSKLNGKMKVFMQMNKESLILWYMLCQKM